MNGWLLERYSKQYQGIQTYNSSLRNTELVARSVLEDSALADISATTSNEVIRGWVWNPLPCAIALDPHKARTYYTPGRSPSASINSNSGLTSHRWCSGGHGATGTLVRNYVRTLPIVV